VLIDYKLPEFLGSFSVCVESSVNKLNGLGAAFCKKKHLFFRSFNIKKTDSAASSGKAESAGIWASAACFKISDSSVKVFKIFFAIGRRGFFFGNIRFVYNDFIVFAEANAGNIEISVVFNCAAKGGKRIFPFAGNNEIAPVVILEYINWIIGNFRSAKNYYAFGQCFAKHFSENKYGIYVPDIAGKTDYIRLFSGYSFEDFFNGFVNRSLNNFAVMFVF